MKNAGPPPDFNQGGNFFVGILDRRLGDTNGYLGTIEWDVAWLDKVEWNVIGYSLMMSDGQRPIFQGPNAIHTSYNREYGNAMFMDAISKDGDTGGPVCTYFGNNPMIVAVTVAGRANPDGTLVHGGKPMVELVQKALREYP